MRPIGPRTHGSGAVTAPLDYARVRGPEVVFVIAMWVGARGHMDPGLSLDYWISLES